MEWRNEGGKGRNSIKCAPLSKLLLRGLANKCTTHTYTSYPTWRSVVEGYSSHCWKLVPGSLQSIISWTLLTCCTGSIAGASRQRAFWKRNAGAGSWKLNTGWSAEGSRDLDGTLSVPATTLPENTQQFNTLLIQKG